MKSVEYSPAAIDILNRFNTNSLVEKLVHGFSEKANSFERVNVLVWKETDLYIEVHDTRKQYPYDMRCLVTVNGKTGEIKVPGESSEHSFARKGWFSYAESILGNTVSRYDG